MKNKFKNIVIFAGYILLFYVSVNSFNYFFEQHENTEQLARDTRDIDR